MPNLAKASVYTKFFTLPSYPMKHFLILLALAILNTTFWLTELLLFGWGGMEWLDHLFWAFIAIPGFSIAWAAYYTKEIKHVGLKPAQCSSPTQCMKDCTSYI